LPDFFKRSNDRQRLEALIASYRAKLKWREVGTVSEQDHWLDIARELLAEADEAIRERERERAWGCVHTALRLEVFGYERAEVEAASIALGQEADAKLGSWRRTAILKLLSRHEPETELIGELPTSAELPELRRANDARAQPVPVGEAEDRSPVLGGRRGCLSVDSALTTD
jgi:hypothetical protein